MQTPRMPSMSQIEQRAKSAQREMESRIRNIVASGRVPTEQELKRLGEEMARKLRY